MKTINVIGAAIIQSGKILCTRRPEGKQLAGYWEFPGGKIEAGESPEEALHREIFEELECAITIHEHVSTTEHVYEFGTIRLSIYTATLPNSQTPHLTEHAEARWLYPSELHALTWAPADSEAVSRLSRLTFPEEDV